MQQILLFEDDTLAFEQFLNQAETEPVELFGIAINLTRAQVLKRIAPKEYSLLYQAWRDVKEKPVLRVVI